MGVKPGYKQTAVGVIPEDWEAVYLDRVSVRGSGHTPSKSHPEYWGGGVKWVSLQDSDRLDRPYLYDSVAHISPAGIANSSAVLHPPGTVVLSRDAGVGKSTILGAEMAVSQHFIAWICGPTLQNQFLYYWLQSQKPEFERIAAGSTIKTIGLPYFRNLMIPRPPLREQLSISKALSDADALIESLEQLLAKKRDLKQAAMQQLLTGKTRLPGYTEGWQVKRLGELGTFSKGKGIKKDQARSGDLPCIRYGELYTRHNDVIREFFSCISPDVAASATRLAFGDILFAGSGETKEEIGKCSAFVSQLEAYAGGDIIIFRAKESSPVFLAYYLNSPPIARQKASSGQGDAVVHIGATALANINAQFPPLPEQLAIATILTDIDTDISALETKLAKAQQIKQGMMQELLTGRIRLV